jgi:RNA polymerase sigma factor (TIGR02999 family)
MIGPDNVADITELLDRWSRGDEEAFKTLMPLVYEELRDLADHYLRNERSGHTLQPTALVHEAYLRLSTVRGMRLENRTHFYGAAARIMRRLLVDYARHRKAAKRGGAALDVVPFEAALDAPLDLRLDFAALNDALDALAAFAPDKARVVELRYFGGLSIDETASFLKIAPATVKRHWTFARAWLYRALAGAGAGSEPESR